MRRTKPASIGEILSEFFSSNNKLSKVIMESKAMDEWKKIAGEDITRHVTRINVSYGKMFIYVDSSVIRQEIFMRRSWFVREINTALGEEFIKAIVVK